MCKPKRDYMPEKETTERAQEDAREGKSPSTQAGQFVREEMHHIREGKHGRSLSPAGIAIGLSKAGCPQVVWSRTNRCTRAVHDDERSSSRSQTRPGKTRNPQSFL